MRHCARSLGRKISTPLTWSVGTSITRACICLKRSRAGIADFARYRHLLESDLRAWDDLLADLVVGETYFFRDVTQFEFIRREHAAWNVPVSAVRIHIEKSLPAGSFQQRPARMHDIV